jgi:hypothetical protein
MLGCMEVVDDILYHMTVSPLILCSTTEPRKYNFYLFLQSVSQANMVSMKALPLCLTTESPGHRFLVLVAIMSYNHEEA